MSSVRQNVKAKMVIQSSVLEFVRKHVKLSMTISCHYHPVNSTVHSSVKAHLIPKSACLVVWMNAKTNHHAMKNATMNAKVQLITMNAWLAVAVTTTTHHHVRQYARSNAKTSLIRMSVRFPVCIRFVP